MIHQEAAELTVRVAVSGEPEAEWTDPSGQIWTSSEILSQWSQERLEERAGWGEGALGMPSVTVNGHTILTMLPPGGESIPDEIVPS